MKELIIICEGTTEQMFCDQILRSHFAGLDIQIQYPLIAHSNGGIVKWVHLKKEIETHYATNNNRYITTFIDYYGIESHHGFPDWALAHAAADKSTVMDILEAAMKQDLIVNARPLFIPYIQLHEFEAIVLSDNSIFGNYYLPTEFNSAGLAALCLLAPESINNGVTTAPSKRLKGFIPSYDKVTDGVELTKLIGLQNIRAKCPRFNQWIANLEAI